MERSWFNSNNVSCTTLTPFLHNSNYFFFFFFFFFLWSTIGFVFLHVGLKYSMVDFKKMLLELCKNCVRVMQKTLLGLTHLTFKIINYYYYYYDNDNIFNNKSRHSEMRILLVYMLIVHRHRHALRAFSAMLCILPNKKTLFFLLYLLFFQLKKKEQIFYSILYIL
jgi:hypothetical protein